MANRRQFLAGTVASSALMTSIVARAQSLLENQAAGKSLAAFVYDDRFVHGPAIAQGFARQGTATYAVSGDVAEVWYDRLAPGLRQDDHSIGGLTTAGSLFVLARLGHDAGLALVVHGQHRLTRGGEAEDIAMDAPDLVSRGYQAALADGTPWQVALQAALLEATAAPSTRYQSLSYMGPYATSRHETLHSWLLMPRDSQPAGRERIGR